jgi:hypothetical protein
MDLDGARPLSWPRSRQASRENATLSLAQATAMAASGLALPGQEISAPAGQNVLNVFFSSPLAWRDRSNRLHPLETLDYSYERDALAQVFREVQRDISVCFDFATTDCLRTALSFGCRALHFSGHGHPQCLNFGKPVRHAK